MFGKVTYLVWLALFIALPLALLWWRWGGAIGRQWRALAWVVLGSLVGGWIWDVAAVRFGLWYYDPGHLVGLWMLGLPLEEWLWIVGVTLLFGSLTVVLAEQAGLGAVQPLDEPTKEPTNSPVDGRIEGESPGDAALRALLDEQGERSVSAYHTDGQHTDEQQESEQRT